MLRLISLVALCASMVSAIRGGAGRVSLNAGVGPALGHVVQIEDSKGLYLCSGTLVSATNDPNAITGVVTGKSCVSSLTAAEVFIVAGRVKVTGFDGVSYAVTRIDLQETGNLAFLLPKLQIATAAPGSVTVSAAIFDTTSLVPAAGDSARLAGWGKTSFAGSPADNIRYGVTQVQPCGTGVDDICHFSGASVTACELDVGAPIWTDTDATTIIGINIRNQATSDAGCSLTVDDVILYAGLLSTGAGSNREWLQARLDTPAGGSLNLFNCWQGEIRLQADYYQADFSATLRVGSVTVWSVVHTGSPGANGGGIFRIQGGDINVAGYVCTDDDTGTDFTLTVNDAWGDGLTNIRAGMNQDDVFYRLVVNGNTVVEGFDYSDSESTNFVPATTRYNSDVDATPTAIANRDALRTVIVGLQRDRFSEASTSVQVTVGDATHVANHLGLVVQTLLTSATVRILDTDDEQVHGYGVWLAKQGDCSPRLPNGARFGSNKFVASDFASVSPCTLQNAFASSGTPSADSTLDTSNTDLPSDLLDGKVVSLTDDVFSGCSYPTPPDVGFPTCP